MATKSIQFIRDNGLEVSSWLSKNGDRKSWHEFKAFSRTWHINTPDGEVEANYGDWITSVGDGQFTVSKEKPSSMKVTPVRVPAVPPKPIPTGAVPMTTPTLQSQLRLLAEAAGYEIKRGWCLDCTHTETVHDVETDACGIEKCPCASYLNSEFPGASGTLASKEVGLVQEWIMKAGYSYRGMKYKDGPYVFNVRADGVAPVEGRSFDSLERCVTQVVLLLPLDDKIEEAAESPTASQPKGS